MRFILATSLAFLILSAFDHICRASALINEASVATTSDWVEIYNTASDSAELSQFWLEDLKGNIKTLSGTIEGGGFKAFDWSNRLDNAGDVIKLFREGESDPVDQVSYGDEGGICAPETIVQAIGRLPDGSGNFVRLSTQTKGFSNNESSVSLCPTPTPTPTPSLSPTSTPSVAPKITPKPGTTPTPTALPKVAGKTTASPKISSGKRRQEEKATGEAVLGITQVSPSPKSEESPEAVQTSKPARLTLFVAALLVLLGLGFLSFALAPFVKEFLAGYNKLREEPREEV